MNEWVCDLLRGNELHQILFVYFRERPFGCNGGRSFKYASMTMRSVQDRFWSDGWVRKLNPLDRYLFLYLLTNEHSSWCGVYELEMGVMAFESGLDERELERSMLPRLAPKVIYFDGWVYIPNWTRHHASESGNLSPQQKKGVEAAWAKVPERIRLTLKEIEADGIPYAYPMGGVSASSSALASSFTSGGASREVLEVPEKEEEEKPKTKPKYPNAKSVFACFGDYPKHWERNSTYLQCAEDSFFVYEESLGEITAAIDFARKNKSDTFCPKINTPHDLLIKKEKLDDYYDKIHG